MGTTVALDGPRPHGGRRAAGAGLHRLRPRRVPQPRRGPRGRGQPPERSSSRARCRPRRSAARTSWSPTTRTSRGTGCWWSSPARRAARISQALGSRFAGMESFDDGALLVFADGEPHGALRRLPRPRRIRGPAAPDRRAPARGGGLPRTRPGDLPAAMTRLDELDLSLDLSKKEEAARLEAAQERLLELRLTLGGQIGAKELGPPLCVVFEGGDASGQGRRDQAPRRPARSPPRARGRDRRADARREAPSLPVALLAAAARLGRDGGARPLLVRARARRARGGVRRRGGVAARLRGDQRLRAQPRPGGDDPRQVLAARLARGAAASASRRARRTR